MNSFGHYFSIVLLLQGPIVWATPKEKPMDYDIALKQVYEAICDSEAEALNRRKKENPPEEPPQTKGPPRLVGAVKNNFRTPRELLKFLMQLSVSSRSFPNQKEQDAFYAEIERDRRLMEELFWKQIEKGPLDKKEVRKVIKKISTLSDQSADKLSSLRSPCGMTADELSCLLRELKP